MRSKMADSLRYSNDSVLYLSADLEDPRGWAPNPSEVQALRVLRLHQGPFTVTLPTPDP